MGIVGDLMIVILTIVVIVLVAVPTKVETVTPILQATETHDHFLTVTWVGRRTADLVLPVRMAAVVTTQGVPVCRTQPA